MLRSRFAKRGRVRPIRTIPKLILQMIQPMIRLRNQKESGKVFRLLEHIVNALYTKSMYVSSGVMAFQVYHRSILPLTP